MPDWKSIFSSYTNSGIYTTVKISEIPSIKKAATLNALDFTLIDLKKVVDKDGFFKQMARSLRFPAYFGMNWDALNDCLTDLSWKPAAGYVIVLAGFKSISGTMASEVETIRSIFESSSQFWRQKEVRFYVVTAR
jgi:RNAse (barnase) inhibitor barstar